MKKRTKIILTSLLAALLMLPAYNVQAKDKEVTSIEATESGDTITVSGTVESGMLAVAVAVYDESGEDLIAVETTAVSSGNKFSCDIDVPSGTYVVKAADYDGGTFAQTVVKPVVTIDAINVTLEAPTVGDKVTTTEVDSEYKQDKTPVVTAETGANYTIDSTMWISGTYTDAGEDFEKPFSGTFESDKYYYAEIFVSAKTGYALSTDVAIKVNGEKPAEVFAVYDNGGNTFFIAKIKPQAASSEKTDTVEPGDETKSVKLSDGAPKTAINTDVTVLADALLTDAEKEAIKSGADLDVYIVVENVDSKVSDTEKKAIEAVIAKDQKIGTYVDIDLFKKVGDNAPVQISETNGTRISLSVVLPDSLVNTDASIERSYSLVRMHDGKAEVIPCAYDAATKTLTFSSEKFSVYAIVYKDAEVTKADTKTAPKTGDAAPIAVVFAIAMFAGLGLAVFAAKKRDMTR